MNIGKLFTEKRVMHTMIPAAVLFLFLAGSTGSGEIPEPSSVSRYVAIDNVCAWPNLTLLPDGTIAAVIHNTPSHGSMEGSIDCWVSRDGAFWEKRTSPVSNEPNTVRMNVATGLTSSGELIVLCSGWTNEQQPGQAKKSPFRDGVIPVVIARSGDAGVTWTQYNGFPSAEKGWTEFVPFGPISPGSDGILNASCYARGIENPTMRCSWLFRSKDDGRTWQKASVIGPTHNETSIMHLSGKDWLAAARINDPMSVDIFYSGDNGTSWKFLQRVTGPREVNGHLLKLKDGRVLLSYGNRVEGERGVLAKFSSDRGKTWGSPVRIMTSLVGDCGYPSSVQRADGMIVTASYSKSVENHQRSHMGVAIWDPEGIKSHGITLGIK